MSDILSEACSLTGWVSTATNTETSCHVLRRCHAGAEGGCTRRYTALSLLCHSLGREESSDPASPASSGRDTSGAAGGKMACQETNEEQHE